MPAVHSIPERLNGFLQGVRRTGSAFPVEFQTSRKDAPLHVLPSFGVLDHRDVQTGWATLSLLLSRGDASD